MNTGHYSDSHLEEHAMMVHVVEVFPANVVTAAG